MSENSMSSVMENKEEGQLVDVVVQDRCDQYPTRLLVRIRVGPR